MNAFKIKIVLNGINVEKIIHAEKQPLIKEVQEYFSLRGYVVGQNISLCSINR